MNPRRKEVDSMKRHDGAAKDEATERALSHSVFFALYEWVKNRNKKNMELLCRYLIAHRDKGLSADAVAEGIIKARIALESAGTGGFSEMDKRRRRMEQGELAILKSYGTRQSVIVATLDSLKNRESAREKEERSNDEPDDMDDWDFTR